MPDFKSLSELEKYLKNNPKDVMKQNIGKTVKYECPVCNNVEEIKIISENKGKCLKCRNEFNVELIIK